MAQPEHPSTASSTDSIQSTASSCSCPGTVRRFVSWQAKGHTNVNKQNGGVWSLSGGSENDSTLVPLLDEIQPTYPAQDPVAAVEVAIAVQLERLRVTEALADHDNAVFGTRTRDSQAIVDPFINEPQCSARDSMRRFLHWYRRANGRREGYQLRKTC
ncbi:hypothetical protein EDD16DRAFT_1732503, partial [Pisolithus croceorrhizus]